MRFLFHLIATTAFVTVTATTWEWAGTFETPGKSYVWTAQQKKNAYADPTMGMVLLPASAATSAALEALKPKANQSFHTSCSNVVVGGTLTPADNKCYKLQFNPKLHTSPYIINTTTTGHMAIFAQHFPTEFERDRHYMQDTKGVDIEPVAQLPVPKKKAPAHSDHSKPWGEAIGACVLVLICTLIGVVFAIPAFSYCMQEYPDTVFTVTNAFAAGALLAAAFYLMLYEATHLIVRPKESEATAYWGSMIILGYLVASVVDFCFTAIHKPQPQTSQTSQTSQTKEGTTVHTTDVEMGDKSASSEKDANGAAAPDASQPAKTDRACCASNGHAAAPAAPAVPAASEPPAIEPGASQPADAVNKENKPNSENGNGNGEVKPGSGYTKGTIFGTLINNENSVRVLSSILIGDFIHNLVDGIVIGAAFLGCSTSVAWGITGATVAHEIAQEIADYVVLTSPKHGGLTPAMALLLNFLSGLSVILGAIIVLAQDNVSNFSQGMLLAFGGGVYLQIGASECMPRVHEYAKTIGLRLTSLLAFAIGACAIGIVLLEHEHCVPAGAAASGGGGHAH